MKKFPPGALYISVLTVLISLIYLVIGRGLKISNPVSGTSLSSVDKDPYSLQDLGHINWELYFHDPAKPFILLLLQLIIIITVSFFFGRIVLKVGMLAVIGEILAGIFLGPSIMGVLAPSFVEFVFPAYSLTSLYIISQVGLIFFMFIIGMELDLSQLKGDIFKAVLISHSSIAFTSLLAIGLSYYIFSDYAVDGVHFFSFAIFMAVALSITAFPVLARMLQETKIIHTRVGTLLMTCAAVDDVTAWCLLAVAVAFASSADFSSAFITIGLAIGYIIIMFTLVKPFVRKMVERYFYPDYVTTASILLAFLLLLVSSFITRFIGIHALFGAFLAGVIIPDNEGYKRLLVEKLKDVSLILFLPVFFTLSGLKTHIELLSSGHMWNLAFLVISLAVVGKIGGGTIFSKLTGQSWKDSLFIGTMLNTRGLMELIVLNIGYDLNIISIELYTIMVLMALTTTFLTSPLILLHKKVFGPVS